MKRFVIIPILAFIGTTITFAQEHNPIKVNQVGYYPNQEKTASVEKSAEANKYTLKDANGKVVWKGKAVRKAVSPWSGKEREVIDFSSVTAPGTYTLTAGKLTQTVTIRDKALSDVAIAGMKSYYYERTGVQILKEYVGEYARPAAHPDTCVLVHPAAANEARPAGSIISSPGGWYDAGDFNKYIVNSGFTIGLLLSAYEMNPDYFDAMNLNIPESNNATPDFLDEIYFNLKWMLTMQDPSDGGLYHKLTTPDFEGFVMPIECHQTRYVTQKSTPAALDFAAVMAKASRIYGKYPEYRDFAKQALRQAVSAYEWAHRNTDVLYDQPGNNKKYEPQINTGMYNDTSCTDEFFWASTELYLATEDMSYAQDIQKYVPRKFSVPVWGDLSGLGVYAWASQVVKGETQGIPMVDDMVRKALTGFADNLILAVPASCYNTPFGNAEKNFHWGCLAETCCGQAIEMLYTYRLTGDKKYLTAALENADYVLGRNATGYCYVTGFGQTPSMHPHQRISSADGIANPIPGMLVGGPNPGQQDKAPYLPDYPSNYPDESYLDNEGSYASNEIAINWNASLVALMGWLDAEIK